MKDLQIAINCGYYIDNNGTVFNKKNKEINTHLKDEKYVIFCFTYMKKKYKVYASRLQSYKKFGEDFIDENVSYINGNTLDCSYDNISLQSIELKNRRNKKTKICTRCKKEFPIEVFKIKNKYNGLRVAECPECNKLSKRECYHKHFEENKEKFRSKNKEFRKNRNEFVNQKKSSGCIICEEKNVSCLDFHHIDNKKYNISSKKSDISIPEIEKEIDKCVILCANCHRKLHYYNLTIDELKEKHTKK